MPSNGAPNCAKARKTAFAFSSSERMKRSRSFVARGCACTPKAWPPMIRYLTAFALKARKRSFRSLVSISRHSFKGGGEGIRGLAQLTDRSEPLSNGAALPIAVGFGLLLLEAGHAADCLVHGHYLRWSGPN